MDQKAKSLKPKMPFSLNISKINSKTKNDEYKVLNKYSIVT